MLTRFLARQFAEPSGLLGRWIIAPWLNRIGSGLNDLAFELLAPRRGERLLEVGYGGGGLLRRLGKVGPQKLVGIDTSAAVPTRIGNAELVRADAAALPFHDEAFDGVVSVSVLHFWPGLERPMQELGRVMRVGARLVLVFEPPEALHRWKGSRHGFQMWTAEDVIRAAGAAGLRLDGSAEGQGRKPDFFVGLRFRKGAE